MDEKYKSLKRTARYAGMLYLAIALIAPYALMYVPSQIFVAGDNAATANNILANEFMFRSAIAIHLATQVIMFLVAMFLYKLFIDVNKFWGKMMVGFVVLGAPISFFSEICNITALKILKGGRLDSFEPEQVHEMSRLIIKMGAYGIEMVQIYWGLWLIPLALLVYKSGFIPRIFGILLFLNGIGYILLSFTFVLFPHSQGIVWNISLPFIFTGEFSFILWLLIKGVKEPKSYDRLKK